MRNPQELKRDHAVRARQIERLETEIEALHRRKDTTKSTKRVCELKSHRSLGRYVRELKSGELRVNRGKVREEERLDGKYLLSTTDPSLSSEDIALGYKQLQDIERAFRNFKITLGLRPLYHLLPESIEAHLLLCWVALLLVRLIESETGQGWERVRDELAAIHRSTTSAKNGRFQVVTKTTTEQRKLLKSLQRTPPKPVQKAQLDASAA